METLKEIAKHSRVRVTDTEFWPSNPLGTVVYGPVNKMQTAIGVDWFYCVKFDAPTHDSSPDGPYIMAEILSRDLKVVKEVSPNPD